MTTLQNRLQSQDYERRNALAQLVCYQLEELFEKLNVDLRCSGRMYIGCCPIHGGDNYSAINLYTDELNNIPAGFWVCNTHLCHRIFKQTIIGFVRGVLSTKYFNWHEDKPDKGMAPFSKVINWLCKFIGKSWDDIKVNPENVERHQFANQISSFKKIAVKQSGTPRNSVRSNLQIPAQYYLLRGYKNETLDNFDVGLCANPGKELCNRAVVPIYDSTGKLAVAFSGRSIFEKCANCKLYHDANSSCPDKVDNKKCAKWYHVGDTGQHLYNWWNAKEHIKNTGHVILVEGPGDVWRLWEAGVYNALGMFGADLTDAQEILLEKSGAMKVTVIRDNDAAGELSEAKLREQLRYYKLRIIRPANAKDVGEMAVEKIKQEIIPCLL